MAAALVEMAAQFAEDSDAAGRAAALRAQALSLAEDELHAYEPVLEAQRLIPRDDPSRAARLADALSRAADSPLAIARAAASVAELGAEVASSGKEAVKGDAQVGVVLAEGACRAAARLVSINLASQPADPRLAEVAGLTRRAAAPRRPTA
jgi:formiminotetrahydrofolate cyclodeaminase